MLNKKRVMKEAQRFTGTGAAYIHIERMDGKTPEVCISGGPLDIITGMSFALGAIAQSFGVPHKKLLESIGHALEDAEQAEKAARTEEGATG